MTAGRFARQVRAAGSILAAPIILAGALAARPAAAADAEALLVAGEQAFVDGDLDLALVKFEAAVEAAPERWEGYYYCGLVNQQKGNAALAEEWYRKAIAKKPDASEAQNNLAVLLLESGKIDEALEASKAAVEADPDGYEAAYTLAEVLEAAGRIEEAIEAYGKSAKLSPGDPDPLLAVADLSHASGDDAAAAAALVEAFARAPQKIELGLMALELLVVSGKREEALALARKLGKRLAGKGGGGMVEAALRVARSLRSLGDPAAALDLLEALPSADMKSFSILTEIGLDWLALGNCKKAAKAFDEALEAKPDSSAAKVAKADSLCCAGKWWKAKKAYKKFLKKAKPGDPMIAVVEAKLAAGKKSCKK